MFYHESQLFDLYLIFVLGGLAVHFYIFLILRKIDKVIYLEGNQKGYMTYVNCKDIFELNDYNQTLSFHRKLCRISLAHQYKLI